MEQHASPSSFEECLNSAYIDCGSCRDDSKVFFQVMHLKKSQSLGNVLERGQDSSCCDCIEDDETDQQFLLGNGNEDNLKRDVDSCDKTSSAELYDHEYREMNFPNHQGSLFSIEAINKFGEELDDDISKHSACHLADSGSFLPHTPPILPKSCSLIDLKVDLANSYGDVLPNESMGPRSRSSNDLCFLGGRSGEFLDGDRAICSGGTFYGHGNSDRRSSPRHGDSNTSCGYEAENQEGDDYSWSKDVKNKNELAEGYDALNCNGLETQWKEHEETVEIKDKLQQESSVLFFPQVGSEEFKVDRIKEWISAINIQDSFSVQEPGESSSSVSKKDSDMVASMTTTKSSPGMQVAYNYISSLTPTCASAQMANLGLDVIPSLSAFMSLRVLNLSGNGIVRVKAGTLPKSLHVLNLSKNIISTIEGLRELSRLRVLDLSYNRISRIGHGLASCSSLKELYLASNKISEVEGVHRLLKLHILDLRFNKISTSKGFEQLAASTSLQTINLDGNPAQRNVGDEQLKRHLLSLLPNLVYFNKQAIRRSFSKEVVDRSTRSRPGLQSDRAIKSERKHYQKGVHGAVQKSVASSSQGRSSRHTSPSTKLSKSRHGRLPPPGWKATNHLPIQGTNLLSLQPFNPIRRIQSEGNL